MTRCEAIASLWTALLARSLSARAEEPATVRRIDAMCEFGHVEKSHLLIEWRFLENRSASVRSNGRGARSTLWGAGVSRSKQLITTLATIVLMGSPKIFAQSVTGSLYGKVVDEGGVALPGVGVTLTGVAAPLTTSTVRDRKFDFRRQWR